MRYSVEGVCEKFKSGEKVEFLFFWGHTKNKNGKVTKACFSQWYLSYFTVNGVFYNCAEEYMMAEKARLFKDYETLEEILSAENQKEIKDLGYFSLIFRVILKVFYYFSYVVISLI